ncbi:MAG: D-glycero-beta-D-manno-heptose 1-phosphate adenylyltransferase [Epsilonproteobacteria bacterium]|nr:D-glycero-beta-D-manno-heptose 1-phosphate adenylyltransferase [Campylobacterota bacterium]
MRAQIIEYREVSDKAMTLHRNGTIVFTNGCFDLLHAGHIEYLRKAKELGNILWIGVNSDKSVKRIKGEKRPIFCQADRVEILASLRFVDAITLFDEDTPLELIKMIKPDILVKGGDYKDKLIVGSDILKNNGGIVKLIDFVDGKSTSAIIKKIKSL